MVTLLVVALGGCQGVDDGAAAVATTPATTSSATPDARSPDTGPDDTGTAAAEADLTYPSLDSVPRRPQLSYTVAQSRAIVEGLVADLENARYTDRVIRYRSGQTSLPPPPPPASYQIAELATEQAKAMVPDAPPPEPVVSEPVDDGAAGTDQVDLRDDTLDAFVADMVDDSEGAPAEVATGLEADSTPDLPVAELTDVPVEAEADPPWREPRSIVEWWDRLFGDDPADDGIATDPPPATAEQTASATLAAAKGPAAGAGSDPILASLPAAPAASDASAALVSSQVLPEPSQVLVVPIPEPSVAIEIAQGLVAIPIAKPSATATATKTVATAAMAVVTPASFPLPQAKPVAPGLRHQAIAFADGEATLSATALVQLRSVATEADGHAARIEVVGEGDSPALALDRAVAVAVQLVRLGVSATDLEVQIAQPITDRDHVVLTMAW